MEILLQTISWDIDVSPCVLPNIKHYQSLPVGQLALYQL